MPPIVPVIADALSHHDHSATAFINLASAKQQLLDAITHPQVWARTKLHDLWGNDGNDVGAGRMVAYFADGCPHCVHTQPIFKTAASMWDQQNGAGTGKLIWQEKHCLNKEWQPGADFKECQDADISGFPTIKFFAPKSNAGEEFLMERSPEQLVDFARTGMSPSPDTVPRLPDDSSDLKLVDFYAASCPHCKHLEPVWDDAQKQWHQMTGQPEDSARNDLPQVTFEKRECYDDNWNPGKDSSMCKSLHIQAFPSIKLFVPDPHGHGFTAVDYEGPRTPESLAKFVAYAAGVPENPEVQQTSHDATGPVNHEAAGQVEGIAPGSSISPQEGQHSQLEETAARESQDIEDVRTEALGESDAGAPLIKNEVDTPSIKAELDTPSVKTEMETPSIKNESETVEGVAPVPVPVESGLRVPSLSAEDKAIPASSATLDVSKASSIAAVPSMILPKILDGIAKKSALPPLLGCLMRTPGRRVNATDRRQRPILRSPPVVSSHFI
jgi:thiol-disulfide isomerase/thioredoxin